MNDQRAEQTSVRTGRSFDWRSLAELGVWTLTLAGIATMVFVIQGVSDPGLPITLVAMLVGLGLTTRDRRWGPIVLLATSAFLLVFAVFFAAQVFLVPQSTLYFVVNVIFVVAGTTTLVSSLMLMRGGGRPSGARRLALAGAAVVGVLAAVAVTMRFTYDEPASGSGDLSVEANDDEFLPDKLSTAAGRTTIVVTNKDLSIHTFSIEDLGVSEYLPGGVNSEVVIDAEPGTYVYFCDIPGHEDMKGTLVVR